eukprot:PhF_6_TR18883/c3_g1_i1/m.27498
MNRLTTALPMSLPPKQTRLIPMLQQQTQQRRMQHLSLLHLNLNTKSYTPSSRRNTQSRLHTKCCTSSPCLCPRMTSKSLKPNCTVVNCWKKRNVPLLPQRTIWKH